MFYSEKRIYQFLVLSVFIMKYLTAQDFKVSLDYPSLVDNNRTNIMTIGTDSQNNFLFSLQNSKARKYNPNLNSYTNFTLEQPVDRIGGVTNQILNGSQPLSHSKIIYTYSQNKTILRTYDVLTFSLLQTYNISQEMHQIALFSFNTTGVSKTFFLMFCPNAFKVAYNSTIYNLSTNIYNGVKNNAVKVVSIVPSISSDLTQIALEFTVILSQTDKVIYAVSYQANLTFDPTLHQYVFTNFSVFYNTPLVTMPFQTYYLTFKSPLIITQENSTGSWRAFNIATNLFVPVNGLLNTVVQNNIFGIYGKKYLLQSTGLSQINITNTSINLLSVTQNLPKNNYRLSFGSLY